MEELRNAEDEAERALGVDQAVEVYAPILSRDGTRAFGAYEIHAKGEHTASFIASRKRVIWIAVIAVFLALYAALAVLVRSASSTMQHQSITLRARSWELKGSYRRLEASSLEAIRSLNATVEAKDPYTAGHSARVQRIAVAAAEELGLPRERLDAVRLHPHQARRSRRRGVRGNQAAPGRRSRDRVSLQQQLPRCGAGVGRKFSPAVVDAFFTAFRRQPLVFEPDEPTLQVAASA